MRALSMNRRNKPKTIKDLAEMDTEMAMKIEQLGT